MKGEPLAIVSMACRFPKLESIDELWKGLCDRFVAAGEVPADRWDKERYFSSDESAKGKTWTRKGNFITQDVKTFDAAFFGISPRKAANIDPPQRLILEVVWEAFENCGKKLPDFAKRQIGVYVGGFMLDHMITSMGIANRSAINQHTAAGMMMTMLSNRVSHTFDFRGPSLSIDTACSSSLVAFHYGCQDVWRGNCEMAVIGGTNVMMRPEYPIGMAKGYFISRDGESKSFDQRGGGYGRGEGAGVALVRPLADAIKDGDTILSLVVGTGTNQDGNTPGISMPNGEAQLALINEVCQKYEVDPATVDYVECHGTGTGIGDPTEATAIGAVYGANRTDNPVVIGSIKSNIGHTEAVAGIAGVIKATLNVMHRTATPLGNLQSPREDIDFKGLGIRLSDELIPLGKDGQPVTAAINSFGYGGSNAHVLLRSAPISVEHSAVAGQSESDKRESDMPYVLPVSGRSKEALQANADALADWMETHDASIADVLYTASQRRVQHNHRAVAMGHSRDSLVESLRCVAQTSESEMAVRDSQPIQGLRQPVFVFTGMGPQWWYMGQQLYASQPLYREFADKADAAFMKVSGFSILAEMQKDEEESAIQKTIYAQPANLVIQIGVFEMLRSLGIEPGVVVGHSVGELGSAYAAGVLSLEDAMLVSYYRSQLQAETAGTGGMLAVGLGKEQASGRIAHVADKVSLAAINGPGSVTLAGCVETLAGIEEELVAEGVFARKLEVEIPYHSPMMNPLMERLEKALAAVETSIPAFPLYSTVTGELVTEASFDAKYWPLNIRQPVEFEAAILSILESGYNTFVEIGPHPVLSAALRDCAKAAGKDCRLIHTLRRNLPNETLNVQRAAMGIFAAGCDFDWTPFLTSDKFVQLPNYRWQREFLWEENDRAQQERISKIASPLLGKQEALASAVWRNDFDFDDVKYLLDHVVSTLPILPAAGYLEAILELGSIQFPEARGLAIRDVEILAPVILNISAGLDFTNSYDSTTGVVTVRSQENGRLGNAQINLTARVHQINQVSGETVDVSGLKSDTDAPEDIARFYKDLDGIGLSYGPMFQTVKELYVRKDKGEVLARVAIDPQLQNFHSEYKLHPTMLDGCFQALMAMLSDSEVTYLPTHIGELCYYADAAPHVLWCLGRVTSQDARELSSEMTLIAEDGSVVATIRGFKATAAGKPDRLDKWGEKVELKALNYQWDYGDTLDEPKRIGHWLAVGHVEDFSDLACERINSLGGRLVGQVTFGDEFSQSGIESTVTYNSLEDFRKVLETTGELSGVVCFASIDEKLRADCPTAQKSLNSIVALSQALLELPVEDRPRVYVVTRNAFLIEEDDDTVDPGSAAAIGYVRVANKELEGLKFTSIDLPDDLDDEDMLEAFVFELLCDSDIDEVALRGDARLISEVLEDNCLTDDVIRPTHLDDEHPIIVRPLREDVENVGMVRVLSAPVAEVSENDIHIRIESKIFPSNIITDQSSDQLEKPWVEIVGTIIGAGKNVSDLAVGTRVCGYAPAELSSHICGDRRNFVLTPIPEDADATELLASMGLPLCARRAVEVQEIDDSEMALVDNSSMGLAVARELSNRGLQVTVISDSPDDVSEEIKSRYPVYLACPESLERAVREQTDGKGFNGLAVNLDSWANAFDFRALQQGGWLIDTGVEAGRTALPSHAGTVSRTTLSSVFRKQARAESSLQEVIGQIMEGTAPLAEDALSISIADIAWQKFPFDGVDTRLVVDYDTAGKDLPMVEPDTLHFRADATYLITGGFGGFGNKTAEWLIENGAQNLVLTGRSGAKSPQAKAIVANLESLGANVTPVACDTSDYAAVEAMFETIASELPPLKGVFHCGAVIIDEAIGETDLNNFNTVMQSKALGAYNLHLLTEKMELDHFVMYSSIANYIGNLRQCSYSAANGYLDGLAHMRRLQGLPANTVNWGAIDDVGVVAADEKLELFFKSIGIRAIPVDEALGLLKLALSRDVAQFGCLLAKWGDWAQYEARGGVYSTRFKTLIEAQLTDENSGMRDQLVAELLPLSSGDRAELMCTLIQQIVASVLKAEPEAIELDRQVGDLGIDSLMATEIQMLMESNLGLSITVLELIGDTTIRSLASNSLASLEADFGGAPESSGAVQTDAKDEESAQANGEVGASNDEQLESSVEFEKPKQAVTA
ncbi:MAG: SDR family NAD(P)-dependent oxidoreductase [Granulosicoccus sp.]